MTRPESNPAEAAAAREEQGESFVDVRLFSVLRERVGASSVRVPLAGAISGAELLQRLAQRHPAVEAHRGSIRLAVGERYVGEEATVEPGDEVALITPVSGG